MADWVNKGSYQDLTDQVLPAGPVSALVPTSQHAGNQVWANNAMTAPGGASGDLGNDLDQAVVVAPPSIEGQPAIEPGTDGKPQARGAAGSLHFPPPAWGKITAPGVVREK